MKKVLLVRGIALIKKENQIILMLTRAVVTAKQILETKMINALRLDFVFTSISPPPHLFFPETFHSI